MKPAASRSRVCATTGAAVRRALTALLLLGAGPVHALGHAPAAAAATCTSAGGVSVVVDFRELGGGMVTACSADGGGRSAAAIFASVGVDLTYATRQPGFVCRVEGAPASDPCVNTSPADAYWGLWWADGSKASWAYSSSSAGALTVPAGGSVGWSWQQDRASGATVPPGVAPPVTRTSTPSPSPSPSPTSSPTPSQSASPTPSHSASPTPTSPPTSAPTSPPLALESPGDSRARKGSGRGDQDRSRDDRSPGDSSASEAPDASGPDDLESPGDSEASAASEAGSPTPDQSGRVPAPVTWGILGLLAIAVVVSAAVTRRRRGPDAR
jgi:hypothetical protein